MIEAPKFKRVVAATVAGSLGFIATACGSPSPSPSKEGFEGGCKPYAVYAQNRWDPLGTAVRPIPNVLAPETRPAYAGDDVIAVDGWFHYGNAVYPTNTPPWNSNIWFKLAD
ncbi:MAG TPA: hypothetical protein VGF75_03150, partial [Candidatus Saccharimonadales bacterium]